MVYDHAVKANGVFYPAGQEVPETNPKTTQRPEQPQKPRTSKKETNT